MSRGLIQPHTLEHAHRRARSRILVTGTTSNRRAETCVASKLDQRQSAATFQRNRVAGQGHIGQAATIGNRFRRFDRSIAVPGMCCLTTGLASGPIRRELGAAWRWAHQAKCNEIFEIVRQVSAHAGRLRSTDASCEMLFRELIQHRVLYGCFTGRTLRDQSVIPSRVRVSQPCCLARFSRGVAITARRPILETARRPIATVPRSRRATSAEVRHHQRSVIPGVLFRATSVRPS